ncbi:AAA family ATPase [Thermosynechococcaceae cyanobacterium Okahandja]
MIPRQLVLRNFLSYRQATLPFAGLHLACICGANGAGKSSLLEAIAWALWGQSRVSREDDVIYYGEVEAAVDFEFTVQGQGYRVVRVRRRQQGTVLELQLDTAAGYRSLTGRSLRATQEKIIQILRLDHATFINSAYLRQGRADEFMAKRPSERKQVLAALLGLEQYEPLAEAARDRARDYKAQMTLLEQQLAAEAVQLAQEESLQMQHQQLTAQLEQQRQRFSQQQRVLQEQQAAYHTQQLRQQEYHSLQQQAQTLTTAIKHLQQQYNAIVQEQTAIARLLERAPELEAAASQWQELKAQDSEWQQRVAEYQRLRQERDRQQAILEQRRQELLRSLHSVDSQLQRLQEQEQQLTALIAREPEILSALEHLEQARAQLQALEQLQQQVFPLLHAKHQLESQRQQHYQRLKSRREELQQRRQRLQQQFQRQPELQQAVSVISGQIETLEKQRIYQEHLREKGLERRRFMEQLQARQREYERQLAQLEQRLELLQQPDAVCPLCQRPLNEEHYQQAVAHNQREREELLNQVWVIREQLAVSEREIQVLRREYLAVGYEVSQLTQLFEQRGQLQQQMQAATDLEPQLAALTAELQELDGLLQADGWDPEHLQERQAIEAQLAALNYDEKNMAIARGQVEKWRWADSKQQELRQAKQHYAQLQQQLPRLQAQQQQLQQDLHTLLHTSVVAVALQTLDAQLAALAYDPNAHATVQAALTALQPQLAAYQDLQRGRSRLPELAQKQQELDRALAQQTRQLEAIQRQRQHLEQACTAMAEAAAALEHQQQQLARQQQQLEMDLATHAKLTAALEQLTRLAQEHQQRQQHLEHVRHQYRLYSELAQAMGKNGIPAMLIETVLPHLEAETNAILGRLSNHQLHIQFITQRSRQRGSGKPIDTLDILIADSRGTRPYESYSGGEAFRINFALRLALARLLAQRCGSDVRFLIIDEGFGTQDAQGCERLIAALNAIAPEFHCILAITHMPALKEAFQTRIEVTKGEHGSQISIIA